MPSERLDDLRDLLRPGALKPSPPTFTAETFHIAPGLLAQVSNSDGEATAAFAALDREALAPLREYPFPWSRLEG
ncbi:hypothetical protein [Embleya sp. NPDC020886]|uniref:hypothetical protein n=1 Tax=Embleya sp. NPDC020886 TaxID=3363980 RepID=UPI0037A29855